MNYPAPAPVAPTAAAPIGIGAVNPNPRSTANLMDWRNMPQYQPPGLRQNLADSLSNTGIYNAINNMPYMFDPRKFIAMGQGNQAAQVNPVKMPAMNSDPVLQGLLQLFGNPAGSGNNPFFRNLGF
jgi:hypothetical protein